MVVSRTFAENTRPGHNHRIPGWNYLRARGEYKMWETPDGEPVKIIETTAKEWKDALGKCPTGTEYFHPKSLMLNSDM